MSVLSKNYTLNNGVEIPKLGLGTWFIDDADAAGLTEHMKSTDQLGWIRKMNSIQSRAEEIVIRELIYTN